LVVPTGTIAATQVPLPATLVFNTNTESTATPSSAVGLGTALPLFIAAPSSAAAPPEDSVAIIVRMAQAQYPYDYVVHNSDATNQLLRLVPKLLATAIDVPEDLVVADSIVPLEASGDVQAAGQYATGVKMLTTTSAANQIQLSIINGNSSLYTNQVANSTAAMMVKLFDPMFSIYSTTSVSGEPAGPGSGSNSGGVSDAGAPIGGGSSTTSSSPSTSTSTAAVIGGSVAAVALVGFGIFAMARRMKSQNPDQFVKYEKYGHQRGPSMTMLEKTPSFSERSLNFHRTIPINTMENRARASKGSFRDRDSRGSGRASQLFISSPITSQNSVGIEPAGYSDEKILRSPMRPISPYNT